MAKAENANTIPVLRLSPAGAETPPSPAFLSPRRAMIGGAAAATVAACFGAVLPAKAETAPSPDEAEFIRLCNRLVEIRTEEIRLYATVPQNTKEQEKAFDEILELGAVEWREIEERLYDLSVMPVTPAGIGAAARAALANAQRNMDGDIDTDSLDQWLAWTVVEALERDAAEATTSAVREMNVACHAVNGIAT